MFDSPFHYKYTQEDRIKISKQSSIQTTKLSQTKKTLRTENNIIKIQKKIKQKKFLVDKKSKIASKLNGGAITHFVEAGGFESFFELKLSDASSLIEIQCTKKSRININQKFSGFSSINFNVEKNAELEINVYSESQKKSLLNVVGVNKGVLKIFISNFVKGIHSDVLFDVENHGLASVLLKSVVFKSLSVKGMDTLKGSGSGETQIKTLLLGEDSTVNLLPSASIQNSKQLFSHSASIERINNDELFYLQTRKFKKQEAEKIIWEGFLKNNVSDFK
ncbi:MAG: SufD family Fe-S cluster assembly protein [Candidatus Marsarchaeota archaeon]|nr:SufD family Fe-S cluster assembly protein [Candidatus Marsarchaeota archaeon]